MNEDSLAQSLADAESIRCELMLHLNLLPSEAARVARNLILRLRRDRREQPLL